MLGSAALALAAGVSGCGFVHASNVSTTKPSGFVLRGHVTVPLSSGPASATGSACTAPPSASDIVAGAPVRVTDPAGHTIALGRLGPGATATGQPGSTCDFPFAIPAVPGGVGSYGVAVGTRPAQPFTARDLREDRPAVLTVGASPAPG